MLLIIRIEHRNVHKNSMNNQQFTTTTEDEQIVSVSTKQNSFQFKIAMNVHLMRE